MDQDKSSSMTVDYVANPDFSFPQAPASGYSGPRRAASLHISPSTPQRIVSLERKSASTLPSFSFNSSDTSGRTDDLSAQSSTPLLASGSLGHRRGASELVGGSARHGTSDMISISPHKSFGESPASSGSPMRKRGHAHRRSAAVSAHDLTSILQPRDANIMTTEIDDPVRSSLDSAPPPGRSSPYSLTSGPSIRPRVGFATNIEIIPRPLSTISSEAESIISLNTATAPPSPLHNGSISPTTRKRKSRSARSSLSEVESVSSAPLSPGSRLPRQCEGYLLKTDPERPMTDSRVNWRDAASPRDFSFPPFKHRITLDRRSSEPSLSIGQVPKPRRSSVSLREPLQKPQASPVDSVAMTTVVKRKSSASRVRAWAVSMISRKDKKSSKRPSNLNIQDDNYERSSFDSMTPGSEGQEPDFEALFNSDPFSQSEDEVVLPAHTSSLRTNCPKLTEARPVSAPDEDIGAVIDLDAALGPNKTPSRDGRSPGFAARRQLHSSRANREFSSPGSIYHRRTESAPALTPFDMSKTPSPLHSPMADVFEEEEEEEESSAVLSGKRTIPVACSLPVTPEERLEEEAELRVQETPTIVASNGAIINVDDATMEDILGPIEIVHDHEEPRASTLTKSSDSSDTPTVLAQTPADLMPPRPSFTISEYDADRRQFSFDAPRIGTSASSAADARTLSSCTSDRPRISVDDIPSLTSSRSTMISSMHTSRRDTTGGSLRSRQMSTEEEQVRQARTQHENRRRKRASIQSLTKLMSGPFGESRSRLNMEHGNQSSPDLLTVKKSGRKRDHRLSKLMFWRSKGTTTQDEFTMK